MTAQQLQDFLHRCIPATAALHIRVVSCGADGVALLMPHAPNRNHKNTVFGGSTALGATVCGWALVHLNCPEAAGNIVIQSSEIRYTAPAHGVDRVDKACHLLGLRVQDVHGHALRGLGADAGQLTELVDEVLDGALVDGGHVSVPPGSQ